MRLIAVIVAVVLGGLIIGGIAVASCQKQPVPASTVPVEQDDDSCLSLEELIERDEDCGYDNKSSKPKPQVAKTTAPVQQPATPPRPRNTRR